MVILETELTRLAAELLMAWGASDGAALLTARHLVESNLMGVDSHGIMRLPQYIDLIAQGEIDPAALVTATDDRGAILALDGNRALGPAAAHQAAMAAAERAAHHGIALVLLRNSGHAGRIGAHTEVMAAAGVMALAFCNSPIYGHFVAPPGAREGRLATNPISFAFPTGGDPVVADFATSAMPEGAIRLRRERHERLPSDVLLDSAGRPTTDPQALYDDPRGVILPLGGTGNGHKGFSLALLVEVMAGTLVGDSATDTVRRGNNIAFIGIAIGATPARDSFNALADGLVTYVRSAQPIGPGTTVMVPGDKERRMRAERSRSGIPIDAFTWNGIVERAARVGYAIPRTLTSQS